MGEIKEQFEVSVIDKYTLKETKLEILDNVEIKEVNSISVSRDCFTELDDVFNQIAETIE